MTDILKEIHDRLLEIDRSHGALLLWIRQHAVPTLEAEIKQLKSDKRGLDQALSEMTGKYNSLKFARALAQLGKDD